MKAKIIGNDFMYATRYKSKSKSSVSVPHQNVYSLNPSLHHGTPRGKRQSKAPLVWLTRTCAKSRKSSHDLSVPRS